MKIREEKIKSLIAELAAKFLNEESNRESLVTVTTVDISPDFKKATIFLSVFPDQAMDKAIAFAKRRRSAFRESIRHKISTRVLPVFDFEPDKGEKNRQIIDAISSKDNFTE